MDFKVRVEVSGQAITPVHDAIVARVDGSLQHRFRNAAAKGIKKVTGTTTGVAGRHHGFAAFLQNPFAHRVRSLQHGAMHDGTAEWRSQGDYRCHIVGPLASGGTRDDASQAVTEEMDFSLRLKK